MVNKKILFLIFVGMVFLIVGVSENVKADWQVKVDWEGNPFEWCQDGGVGSSHNIEKCGYDANRMESVCEEAGEFGPEDCSSQYVSCSHASPGSEYRIVYDNYWYFTDCKGASHNVGRHFANFYGGTSDGGEYYTDSISAYVTCSDGDGDGYSDSSDWRCTPQGDCDDANANIKPGAQETCGDNIDQDCINGDLVCSGVCTPGQTQSCGTNVGACTTGTQTCSNGQWGSCSGQSPVSENTITLCIDGLDNNCNGITDFIDNTCETACVATDKDGDQFSPKGGVCGLVDCNDDNTNPKAKNIYPKATEICDGVDNQCANEQVFGFGQIDENPDEICDFLNTGKSCRSGSCVSPTLYWTSDSAGINKITTEVLIQAGDVFYLVLENFPQQVNKWKFDFEIWEDDTTPPYPDQPIKTGNKVLSGTVQGNKLIAQWDVINSDINNAAQDDDPDGIYEFYFKVKGFASTRGEILDNNENKIGTWESSEYGVGGIGTWKTRQPDKIASGTWEKTGISITGSPKGTFEILSSYGLVLGLMNIGTWEGTGTSGPFKTKGGWELSIMPMPMFGTFITTIKETDLVYQKISPILGSEEITGPTLPTPTCSDNIKNQDETGVDCGGPICSACVGTQTQIDCSQYTLCSDAKTKEKCTEANLCPTSLDGCSWSGTCNAYENLLDSNNNVIGICEYTEDTTDTCDDGILTYSLTALTTGCDDKEDVSIFCSAQTSLPLESKFGILLTIISIIGIYFLFYRRRKKEKILKKILFYN